MKKSRISFYFLKIDKKKWIFQKAEKNGQKN